MIARATADYLVVGSGIAGLRAAVELAPHGRVLVLTKSDPDAGNTGYAQGGIAAAVGDDDSPELHARDTIAAGDGLCDERAVATLVEEGPRYVRELLEWGAAFDRQQGGAIDLAREGAHTVRRVLHARDATGREVGRILFARVVGLPSVDIRDHTTVVQLLVEGGAVVGVRYVNASGALAEARATTTLIATGGAGQVYRETTNPAVATGDGIALAYLAGARVADLEFVQFHPTVLSVPGVPRYLLSEALRGEGARLVNAAGEPFMDRYDPRGDLAARDRVSRAMLREAERTGSGVFLSLAHLPAGDVRARFPLVDELCRRAGLDLARDPLPVGPAAHYLMGGVQTDIDGRTSLPGLFAAGEVACTGVHGANRLASNSLLEGLVFGGRAAAAMAQWDRSAWPRPTTPLARGDARDDGQWARAVVDETAVRDLMWTHAGVFRHRQELSIAVDRLDAAWRRLEPALARGVPADGVSWRLATLVTVSRLVARAALRREESRGAHYRGDFPATDDARWRTHVTESLSESQEGDVRRS